jgi:hypothetical protein
MTVTVVVALVDGGDVATNNVSASCVVQRHVTQFRAFFVVVFVVVEVRSATQRRVDAISCFVAILSVVRSATLCDVMSFRVALERVYNSHDQALAIIVQFNTLYSTGRQRYEAARSIYSPANRTQTHFRSFHVHYNLQCSCSVVDYTTTTLQAAKEMKRRGLSILLLI